MYIYVVETTHKLFPMCKYFKETAEYAKEEDITPPHTGFNVNPEERIVKATRVIIGGERIELACSVKIPFISLTCLYSGAALKRMQTVDMFGEKSVQWLEKYHNLKFEE